MKEASNSIPPLSIKQLLKQDFGLDLNIAGGSGQTRNDPIFVLSETKVEAAQTELSVLRGIGRGRNLASQNRGGGFFWRSIAINLISESSPQIIQRKIETKDVDNDEVVKQKESYYFSRKNLDTKAEQIESQVVHEDQSAGIRFPCQLGWLHFDKRIDNEPQFPGLGYTLAYNAPDIKATVYVYPIQDDAKSQPSYLHAELELAMSEIILVHGEGAIDHDWGIRTKKDHIHYGFILKKEPEKASVLMISERKGHFIKLRCTFIDDSFMRDIYNNFVASLLELIRSGDAPKIRVHLINHRNQVPTELYDIHESDFFELTSNYECLGNWIPNSTIPQYSNEYYKDDIQWMVENGDISEERGKEIFRTEELTEEEYELFLDKWVEDVSEEPESDVHRGYYICPVKAVDDGLTVYAIIIQWGGCGGAVEQVLEGVFYSIDDAKLHLEANGIVIN